MGIDINAASKEILMSELGLSEAVVDRVIRMRAGRPFSGPEDLINVDGIGEATAERLSGILVFADIAGPSAYAANAKEVDELDLGGIIKGKAKVTIGPDGKPKIEPELEFDLGKAINELIKAFGRSSRKDDDDDDEEKKTIYDQGAMWASWDVIDRAIKASPCPEDVKKRLRDLAHNIRTRIVSLRSSLAAGDDEGAAQAASDIQTWLREAQKILKAC